MKHKQLATASTNQGLPISPGLGPALQSLHLPTRAVSVDQRTMLISALAVLLAGCSFLAGKLLVLTIALVTNLAYFGTWSTAPASPANHGWGAWAIGIPVLGGLIIGLMARYGSKAIRGHGIPEAMEQILINQSRIPPRVTFLKPLSAAVSIGTGGPFGAEGPIIATGGALGSLLGQLFHTTADERKILLASGAAAGMSAIFGSPVAAVLLAVELLLFEFRPRSIIPVALASVCAAGLKLAFEGPEAAFSMPKVDHVTGLAMAAYVVIGGFTGVAAIGATRAVYWIEDQFERLPIHWMWWPALGGIAVGVIGYFEPKTLGVGYDNISGFISGSFTTKAMLALCVLKFVSWSISLGSGTSGGTLAPLLTVGGGFGALLGSGIILIAPHAGVDPRMAALVGMAAMFAGASRAFLTSVVFAYETTHQELGLLPLLGGCTAAYLVSYYFMRTSIMTEKIVRRGVNVPAEYSADAMEAVLVSAVASKNVVTLQSDQPLSSAREMLLADTPEASHQGFPVLSPKGHLMGVVTRRDLLDRTKEPTLLVKELIRRTPVVVYDDCSLREAVDHMCNHGVGRLPVISRNDASKIVGIISRSDILLAFRKSLDARQKTEQNYTLPGMGKPKA